MTSIGNNPLANAFATALGQAMGQAMGSLLQRFAQMDITCCCRCPQTGCFEPVSQPWQASMGPGGTANVQLSNGNELQFNENKSEIIIRNTETGEVTRIWGDPHVDVGMDGRNDFDFWGTTTFTLEDGTKITVETEPWNGNENMYVASKVTVTNGDNAVVIDGVSQNQKGDLSIEMSQDGFMTDLMTNDGYTLTADRNSDQWLAQDGGVATQEDLNVTRLGQAYGPDAGRPPFDENLGNAIGAFLFLGILGGVFQAIEGAVEDAVGRVMEQIFRPVE